MDYFFDYDNKKWYYVSGDEMLKINTFLKNIKIDEKTKRYLEDIWEEIKLYIIRLQEYSPEAQNIFLKDYLIKENFNSSQLECELYSPRILELYDFHFFESLNISDDKLKILNKIVRAKDKIKGFDEFEKIRKEKNKQITYEEYVENEKYNLSGNYRKEVVWIGGKEGIEYAHHIPPKPEEIQNYISDFIDFFNSKEKNDLSDPIIKAALSHAIFIKIHPFANGNGRTARILLNYVLKLGINEKYNLNLKYPPLNLSKSFDLTRLSYFKKQNEIIFKEDVDNNFAINAWIRYNILAIEEQLYYLNNRLDKYDSLLRSYKGDKIEKR